MTVPDWHVEGEPLLAGMVHLLRPGAVRLPPGTSSVPSRPPAGVRADAVQGSGAPDVVRGGHGVTVATAAHGNAASVPAQRGRSTNGPGWLPGGDRAWLHRSRSQEEELRVRQVSLIGAPTDVGASTLGCRLGPQALRVAGIGPALESFGCEVRDVGDLSGPPNPVLPPVDG